MIPVRRTSTTEAEALVLDEPAASLDPDHALVQSSPASSPSTPVLRPTATTWTARRCEPYCSHKTRKRHVKATDGRSFTGGVSLQAGVAGRPGEGGPEHRRAAQSGAARCRHPAVAVRPRPAATVRRAARPRPRPASNGGHRHEVCGVQRPDQGSRGQGTARCPRAGGQRWVPATRPGARSVARTAGPARAVIRLGEAAYGDVPTAINDRVRHRQTRDQPGRLPGNGRRHARGSLAPGTGRAAGRSFRKTSGNL